MRPRSIRFAAGLALLLAMAPMARAGVPSEKTWTPHVRRVTVSGRSLDVLDVGAGSPIVLVHGQAEDWRTWLATFEPLVRRHRVIAFSRTPGEGGIGASAPATPASEASRAPSSARRGSTTRTAAAKADDGSEAAYQDLLGLLQSIGAPSVHLVGHGEGATIATMLAADHPECVASLTLVGPDMPELLTGTASDSTYAQEKRLMTEQTRMTVGNDFPDLALAHVLEWNVGPEALEITPKWVQHDLVENFAALRDEVLSTAPKPHVSRSRVKALRCPTLVLEGDKSPWFAKPTGDAILACRPVTERVTLKGCAYSAIWTEPKVFDRALLGFLSRHEIVPEKRGPIAGQ